MSNKGRIHIDLFLAAIFTSGCFFICGCENDPKMIDDWSKKKEMVEVGKNIEAYLLIFFSTIKHISCLKYRRVGFLPGF